MTQAGFHWVCALKRRLTFHMLCTQLKVCTRDVVVLSSQQPHVKSLYKKGGTSCSINGLWGGHGGPQVPVCIAKKKKQLQRRDIIESWSKVLAEGVGHSAGIEALNCIRCGRSVAQVAYLGVEEQRHLALCGRLYKTLQRHSFASPTFYSKIGEKFEPVANWLRKWCCGKQYGCLLVCSDLDRWIALLSFMPSQRLRHCHPLTSA